MKRLLPLLLLILMGCTKPAQSHIVRVITFAVDTTGEYVTPSNTAMYLNNTKCLCFPDTNYGINTNPTFNIECVNEGDELHIITFINAGEPIQYKSIRVYVDNKIVYNVSNVVAVDQIVKLR